MPEAPRPNYVPVSEVTNQLSLQQLPWPGARQGHIKLRQLEIFTEAAQHATIAAAAKAIGVSPAYTSEAIAHLEASLGVQLFERDTGGSQLTPAGEQLLQGSRRLLTDEAAARNAVAPPRRNQTEKPQAHGEAHDRHLTLRQVEIFVEVAWHESFGAAAKSLGVSPTYVSEAVAKLEHALGENVRLFDRDTGGTKLSRTGAAFLEKSRRLLHDEVDAVARLGLPQSVGPTRPQPASRRHNVEDVLAAVEFLEKHASPGVEVQFSPVLVDELHQTLERLTPRGESVERMANILDLMQASVTRDGDLAALLEPENRAGNHFRQLHEASVRKSLQATKDTPSR
jgi:molybdate transport repressor ModE-like protein